MLPTTTNVTIEQRKPESQKVAQICARRPFREGGSFALLMTPAASGSRTLWDSAQGLPGRST